MIHHRREGSAWILLGEESVLNRCVLGEMSVPEEHLLFGYSVMQFHNSGLMTTMQLETAVRDRPDLAWTLLDHLKVMPLYPKLSGVGPLVEFGEGGWTSVGQMRMKSHPTYTRPEPVRLEAGRILRFMQLLGMVDHSRREEWERGVDHG